MHFQLPLVLGIAATALALPTANQTTSNLEKRSDHGWIGSFSDSSCTGPQTGPRPELHFGDCTVFSPANPTDPTAYFGIFWGTGVYSFHRLSMFSDAGCQNSVADPSWYLWRNTAAPDDGDFTCMRVEDFAWPFGSVSAQYPVHLSDG